MSPRIAILFTLVLAACDKGDADTRCPDAAATPAASGSANIDVELAKLAGHETVQKFKLRVDEAGVADKQSLYHGDATAIPEPVLALARERYAGAKIERYESELYREHGRIFEVELTTAEGQRCEIAASADATELYTECRLTPETMPAPIRDAITKLYPQGKVVEVETKRGPKVDEVTVEVELADGREHYVRLQPDGTLLARYARVPAVLEVPLR
ncbi:MAG TPA: hypothetical protein VG755_35315 [Nannocystaceae bacterium]|nr:hypothetical protein [Nannocystaceae bacterium]